MPAHVTARRRAWPLALALLLAAAALLVNALLWQRVEAMKAALAGQSREMAAHAEAAAADARQARDVAQSTAARMNGAEERVADMARWRAQLQELLGDAVPAHDENMAVELETALLEAQSQAQLSGRAEPLLAALRTAERRLARNIDPRLLPAARAVAQDLERLRAAPAVDEAALLARIARLASQVHAWPAVASLVHAAAPIEKAASAPSLPDGAPWWRRALHAAGQEARALVRVSSIGRADAAQLAPAQVMLVRERLRLHLQGARLALLGHSYEAARSDLAAAAALLGEWFEPDSRRVQAALQELDTLQRQCEAAPLPGAQASLRALGEAAENAIAAKSDAGGDKTSVRSASSKSGGTAAARAGKAASTPASAAQPQQ